MKSKRIIICGIVILLLSISIFPCKKYINSSYSTTDAYGKKITVTINGTYRNYLFRKDRFKGTLIDEAGRKYISVDKPDLSKQTIGVKGKEVKGISFVCQDVNTQEAIFAMVYFDKNFKSVYQCNIIK